MRKAFRVALITAALVMGGWLVASSFAQSSGFHFTLPQGYFASTGDNETTVVSTKDDPPKHRLGVEWQQGWGRGLGALSWNHVRQSGVQDEMVLMQGKMDDRYAFGSEAAGELRLDVKAPGPSTDESMRGVLNIFHDRVDFHVPITAPNLGSGNSGDKLISNNGRYRLYVQCDGNLVLYDTLPAVWVALWSSGTSTGGC